MIEVYKRHEKAIIPTRAYPTDAGLDLYLLEDVFIPNMLTKVLPTGISINIPEGYVGKIEDRSSLAKDGLRTGGGIIDAGYNGEILVVMHNITNNTQYVAGEYGKQLRAGDKIAQLLIIPVDTTGLMQTTYLWNSPRDNNGFGSSGV